MDDTYEQMWDLVKSIEASYVQDLATPGFLYRKDARSVFGGPDYVQMVRPSAGLVNLKIMLRNQEQTMQAVTEHMFFAGYLRLFSKTKEGSDPSLFITDDYHANPPEGMTPQSVTAMQACVAKVISDDNGLSIHLPDESGAGIWGWAFGYRYRDYQEVLSGIEEYTK